MRFGGNVDRRLEKKDGRTIEKLVFRRFHLQHAGEYICVRRSTEDHSDNHAVIRLYLLREGLASVQETGGATSMAASGTALLVGLVVARVGLSACPI